MNGLALGDFGLISAEHLHEVLGEKSEATVLMVDMGMYTWWGGGSAWCGAAPGGKGIICLPFIISCIASGLAF